MVESSQERAKRKKAMLKKVHKKAGIAFLCVMAALAVLAGRIAWINYNHGDAYSKAVLDHQTYTSTTKETRLYCSGFHAVIDLKTGRPCNQGKEIVIGNHVWLGEGVKILKNCHVTDNVIIGIGSVVTKDLTTGYAMYAGNPAVCKKTDINWVPEAYDLAMAQLESQQE